MSKVIKMKASKLDLGNYSNRLNICSSLECGLHFCQRREPLGEERELLSQQQLVRAFIKSIFMNVTEQFKIII